MSMITINKLFQQSKQLILSLFVSIKIMRALLSNNYFRHVRKTFAYTSCVECTKGHSLKIYKEKKRKGEIMQHSI